MTASVRTVKIDSPIYASRLDNCRDFWAFLRAEDKDQGQPSREEKRDESSDAGCSGKSRRIEMRYNGVCHDGSLLKLSDLQFASH